MSSGRCSSCATRSGPARRFIDLADAQRRAEAWCRAAGRDADPRHHAVPPRRAVHAGGAPAAVAGPGWALRRADLRHREGAPRSPHRSRQGALLGARQPDRCNASRCAPTVSWCGSSRVASWSRPIPASQPGRRVTDPDDLPDGTAIYALRDIEHLKRLAAGHGPAIGDLRRGVAGHPAAVDQDAPGLRPVGPGQEVGRRACRGRLRPGVGGRSGQRRADRPDARTRHREHTDPARAAGHRDHRPVRSRPRPLRCRRLETPAPRPPGGLVERL